MPSQPRHAATSAICLFVLIASCYSRAADAPAFPNIPELAWEQRSDWLNVKSAVQPGAKGDGVADDTDAVQAVLNKIVDGATVYFPPGTYRLTRTLQIPTGRFLGVTLLGHGRSTILAWDGPAGGRMFWTAQGMTLARYVGLTWDGRNKAAVGFDHSCTKTFETEIRHQYEAYRNFTEAGIRVGFQQQVATAETLYDNCLFAHCGHGVSIHSFNDLDHTFDGCEFRQCGVGIFGGKGTNLYARNSHFEGSAETDIVCRGEQGSSVRRCTSHGSKQFLQFGSSVGPIVIQDCRVAAWTGGHEAILLSGAPVLMFDCIFSHGPAGESPVRTGRAGQRLTLSSNKSDGEKPVVQTADGGKVIEIPPGELTGVTESATQTFLRDTVRADGKIFDARHDFGAKGDGTADDTAAINKTIAAARVAGNGAIAYLPAGRYVITDTIRLSGSNYTVGGSGYRSCVLWKGKAGGTMVEISDPDHLTLENLVFGHHDCGIGDNAIDIQQTGTGGKPTFMCYDRVFVWGMYQKKPLERGLRLVGLGKQDRVHFHEIEGNIHITDSAAATIYLGLSYEGTILVEGKSPARDGFLGGSVRLGTITDPAVWLRDNQSMAMSDLYVESSEHLLRLEGSPDLPAGRVTLQGAKFELSTPANNAVEVNNYRGELTVGPYQFYVGNPIHHFVQKGDAPFALTLLGGLFYNSKPEFDLAPGSKLAVVGCDSVVLNQADAIDSVPGVSDTSQTDAMPRLRAALDDLRRIGKVDRQMTSEH